MYYLIILIGVFLGLALFYFLFIAAKKTGLYYLPPLITFLVAIGIIVFSLTSSDMNKIGYGLMGIGFLIAAVVCALLLPAKLRTSKKRSWTKSDVIGLVSLPCILSLSIGLFMHFSENSRVVEGKEFIHVINKTDSMQGEQNRYMNLND